MADLTPVRQWLYDSLGTDFANEYRFPGTKVYDTDWRFQKWVNGMNHDSWVSTRANFKGYTTCMDFLLGVDSRILMYGGFRGSTLLPNFLNAMPGYRTFDSCADGDFPQTGDFYYCSIPGGHHVGVFLEVYYDGENGYCFTICGGADDQNGGAIGFGSRWPNGFLGWVNIDEFYCA